MVGVDTGSKTTKEKAMLLYILKRIETYPTPNEEMLEMENFIGAFSSMENVKIGMTEAIDNPGWFRNRGRGVEVRFEVEIKAVDQVYPWMALCDGEDSEKEPILKEHEVQKAFDARLIGGKYESVDFDEHGDLIRHPRMLTTMVYPGR